MNARGIAARAVGVFAGYMAVAFLSWAYHPGNAAKPLAGGQLAEMMWTVVSFPTFILMRSFANRFFWLGLIVNGILWTLAILGAILITGRRGQ